MPQDHYTIIGVRRDADPDEIKKVYRRLARELHPDVNPDPESRERFKDITRAYDVLSDPGKRQMYDQRQMPFQDFGGQKDFTFSDFFNQLTAGKTDAEKLHYATEYQMAAEAKALLEAGVVPAKETMWFVLKQRKKIMPGWAKKLLAAGKPDSGMLDYAAQNNMVDAAAALIAGGAVATMETLRLVLRKWKPSDPIPKLIARTVKVTPG